MISHVINTISRLSSLSSAIIDTSSLIYLSKINCLSLLAGSCRLYSIREVADEFNEGIAGIEIIAAPTKDLSTDQKLIQVCVINKFPLISEDKKLLVEAQRCNIIYFNSLIMLNFLLLKKQITGEKYSSLVQTLRSVARYGENVWRFGELVNKLVKAESNT